MEHISTDLVTELRAASKGVTRDDGYEYLVPAADIAHKNDIISRAADLIEKLSVRLTDAEERRLRKSWAEAESRVKELEARIEKALRVQMFRVGTHAYGDDYKRHVRSALTDEKGA